MLAGSRACSGRGCGAAALSRMPAFCKVDPSAAASGPGRCHKCATQNPRSVSGLHGVFLQANSEHNLQIVGGSVL